MSVIISKPLITRGKVSRVEADITVNEKTYAIWYESEYLDEVTELQAANSYLVISVFAGMATGQNIESRGAVSPELVDNMYSLQSVFAKWFPEFKKVSIHAPLHKGRVEQSPGVATTFSGGVDSYFTMLENKNEIGYLLNARGFDIKLDDDKMYGLVNSSLQKIAKHHKKSLINISTNVRELLDDFGDWGYHTHAAALTGIAHILSSYIGKMYIPSTYNYSDLFPWGSHPITDRLWGSSYIDFIHHAADSSRFNKIERIAQSQFALDNLIVCWQRIDIPDNVRNCSRCEKCVRTMMALEAIDKLSSQKSFSQTLDLDALRSFRIPSDHDYVFMKENFEYISRLDSTPKRKEILSAIQSSLDWYVTNELVKDIKNNSSYIDLVLEDKDVLELVSQRLWITRTKKMLKMATKYTGQKILSKTKR